MKLKIEPKINSITVLGPKKVLVLLDNGVFCQRRLKDDRFVYNDKVYEVFQDKAELIA